MNLKDIDKKWDVLVILKLDFDVYKRILLDRWWCVKKFDPFHTEI